MVKRLLILGLAAFVLAGAPAVRAAVKADDAALITRVEHYLNGLSSIKAEFVQLTSDGKFAQGVLYMARPNRLRFDYAPPSRLQIYANGTWLKFVDTELSSVTQVPLQSTAASVLVSKPVSLEGEVTVTKVVHTRDEIRIRLVETDDPEAGSVALVFRDRPLRLVRWSVTDPQGIETEVSLIKPEFNTRIDPAVFVYAGEDEQPAND